MERVISRALEYRFLVLIATMLLVAFGIFSMQHLPIDAVPDITPNQVLVLTRAPSLSPPEIEQAITFPIETAMSGLPGVTNIQSVTKNGLSYVAIYFREDMNIYFCRQLVNERLADARESIPQRSGTPELGPVSTGLGEIYQFKISGPKMSLMELRSILDWNVAPKLRSVPGIVEVNSQGGELRTYEVQLDNDKLMAYRISLATILDALEKNNANAGGRLH
jgi:heavy metal efflux system protein